MIWIAAHAGAVKRFSMRWIAQLRKIYLPLFNRRHCRALGLPLAITAAFITQKEECFIFDNRPANRSAELVLLQRFGCCCKEAGGIKSVVPQEFIQSSVEIVGAGFRNDVGRRSEAAAK